MTTKPAHRSATKPKPAATKKPAAKPAVRVAPPTNPPPPKPELVYDPRTKKWSGGTPTADQIRGAKAMEADIAYRSTHAPFAPAAAPSSWKVAGPAAVPHNAYNPSKGNYGIGLFSKVTADTMPRGTARSTWGGTASDSGITKALVKRTPARPKPPTRTTSAKKK